MSLTGKVASHRVLGEGLMEEASLLAHSANDALAGIRGKSIQAGEYR